MKKTKIKIVANVYISGNVARVGDVVEVESATAAILIRSNKAVPADLAEPVQDKPKKAKPVESATAKPQRKPRS